MDLPKKKSHLESILNQRDRATGGFVGVYTHRKPGKKIDVRGFTSPLKPPPARAWAFFSPLRPQRPLGAADRREALANAPALARRPTPPTAGPPPAFARTCCRAHAPRRRRFGSSTAPCTRRGRAARCPRRCTCPQTRSPTGPARTMYARRRRSRARARARLRSHRPPRVWTWRHAVGGRKKKQREGLEWTNRPANRTDRPKLSTERRRKKSTADPGQRARRPAVPRPPPTSALRTVLFATVSASHASLTEQIHAAPTPPPSARLPTNEMLRTWGERIARSERRTTVGGE